MTFIAQGGEGREDKKSYEKQRQGPVFFFPEERKGDTGHIPLEKMTVR